MTNRPFLITGCQRSGTTLLNLILDSHPQIHGVDEMEFRKELMQDYLANPKFHPFVVFKLPKFGNDLDFIKSLSNIKVLWCMRNPMDVVLSMISLRLPLDNRSTLWANHPQGAEHEIDGCIRTMRIDTQDTSSFNYCDYLKICEIPHLLRGRKEAVYMAALCWKLKNELLMFYNHENISYQVIRYEDLIVDSKATLEKALAYLELHWHDDMLRHHELHDGMAVGLTQKNRAIDPSNLNKWVNVLRSGEVAIIKSLCNDIAQKFDYQLSPLSSFIRIAGYLKT